MLAVCQKRQIYGALFPTNIQDCLTVNSSEKREISKKEAKQNHGVAFGLCEAARLFCLVFSSESPVQLRDCLPPDSESHAAAELGLLVNS